MNKQTYNNLELLKIKYNNRNCIELEIEKDFSIKEITNTYFESKEWENYE